MYHLQQQPNNIWSFGNSALIGSQDKLHRSRAFPSQDCPHLGSSATNSGILRPPAYLTNWLQIWEFPYPPHLNNSQNSGKPHAQDCSVVIKDTNHDQPKENTLQTRSWRVPNVRFLCYPLSILMCITNQGPSLNLQCPEFLIGVSFCRHG